MTNGFYVRATYVLLLGILLAVLSGQVPARAEDAGALIVKGQDFLKQGQYQKAREAFSAAVKADPGSAEAFRLRAESRFFLKDYKGAVQDYSKAVEIDPGLLSAYGGRAAAKYFMNDFKGMIPDETIIIKLDDRNVDAYNGRALARFQLGDYAGAPSDLDQVVRLRPSAQVHFNRGIARQNLNDLEGAVSDFRNSLEMDPKHPDAAEASKRLKELEPKLAASGRSKTPASPPLAAEATSARKTPGQWFAHAGGDYRLPLPPEVTVYAKGGGEQLDAIAWPDLRLTVLCRRDSGGGDMTRDFLRDAFPGAPGRQATMLAGSPRPTALVARYAAGEKVMYWHFCLVQKGRSYFITVAQPAQAPVPAVPPEAQRLLDGLDFQK